MRFRHLGFESYSRRMGVIIQESVIHVSATARNTSVFGRLKFQITFWTFGKKGLFQSASVPFKEIFISKLGV